MFVLVGGAGPAGGVASGWAPKISPSWANTSAPNLSKAVGIDPSKPASALA